VTPSTAPRPSLNEPTLRVPRPTLSREDLMRLRVRDPLQTGVYLASVGVGIVLAVGLYVWAPGAVTLIAAFVLIAGLQHHLSIVHHEAVHHLLFPSRRWNELIGCVAAYPVGFTMAYRRQHFDHHNLLGTDRDPDLPNYRSYPATLSMMLLAIAKDLSGVAAVTQFMRQSRHTPRPPSMDEPFSSKSRRDVVGLAAAQLGVLAAFWAVGHPTLYFTLWLLPLVTLTKTLTHLRNIARHAQVRDVGDPELSRYRTTRVGPIERFFFAPMNFNYHAEHHFYPMIPWHNLPEAYRLLSSHPAYAKAVETERGVLRFIFRKAVRPAGAA
jgi:fatty acid desaturase